MAKKADTPQPMSLPLQAMLLMGILGALLAGGSFWIIQYWPLPVSIVPYYTFQEGLIWGACLGAFHGLILGFITDESHFQATAETK